MEVPETLSRHLAANLKIAKHRQSVLAHEREDEEKVHVVGAGATITAGYEQLRNAAEHAEENVLLQRAIRRFYRRLFLSRDRNLALTSGDELIIELTLAGYLANDSTPRSLIDKIGESAAAYFDVYMSLDWRNDKRDAWTLDALSVEIESMLSDYTRHDMFIEFSYNYFLDHFKQHRRTKSENHDVSVFIATHRALLKSDQARIRWTLLQRYNQRPTDFASYTKTNELIDKLFEAEETENLYRIINRQGAAFRVLWQMIDNDDELDTLLGSREQFLLAYEAQVEAMYTSVSKKIRKGIVKSVIFLFITKVVIGVVIEVPYDLFVDGAVLWLPLAVNLLFPPLYMVLLSNTLLLPGGANTQALINRIDNLLYAPPDQRQLSSRQNSGSYGWPYRMAYAFFIVLVISAATFGLYKLGFGVLHMVIFFVFLSTASFLGFSLSRLVREVEALDSRQSGVALVRDFLYMPFVLVGRWMSEKYQKINIVASILDMVIELPLKTVLRLVRQWAAFLSEQKDRL